MESVACKSTLELDISYSCTLPQACKTSCHYINRRPLDRECNNTVLCTKISTSENPGYSNFKNWGLNSLLHFSMSPRQTTLTNILVKVGGAGSHLKIKNKVLAHLALTFMNNKPSLLFTHFKPIE